MDSSGELLKKKEYMFGILFFLVVGYIVFKLFIAYSTKQTNQPKTNYKTYNPVNPPVVASSKTKRITAVDNSSFFPDYTIIDIETTGLNYRTDKIIQFVAIRVREHQIVDSMQVMINPEIPIPPEATKVNGIKDSDVEGLPNFSYYVQSILEFLGDDYIVGHNIHFDKLFLEYHMGESLMNKRIDTLTLARDFYSLRDGYSLSNLYQYFTGEIPQNAHDALYDCKMTHTVFEGMKKDLGEKGRKLNPKAYDVDMIWYHYELPKREFKKPENCKDLPLYKQHIVFTGKIPDMTRRQAIQAVFDNGGDYGNQIRQKTTMIVVGEYQNDSTIEIAKTGLTPDQNIKIIDANEFKDIVGWIHANSV